MGLSLTGVKRTFNASFTLSLDMKVDNGITILFGPSGCGKTSALRLIAGLLMPNEGRIQFDEVVLFDAQSSVTIPVHERHVGFMFQHPSLFPHMTVEANIGYGAGPGDEAEKWIAQFQLTDLRSRYPRELSGGEMQRVALARSLAARPRLLLLDEPFSALDERRRRAFQTDLLRIKEETDIPILLVTHNLNEAFSLADRLIVLDEGRIVESYDAISLFSHPQRRVTAELLGVENLMPCEVKDITDTVMVVSIEACEVQVEPDTRFRAGDRIWLGIRAVDVRLVVTDEPRENEVTATIHRIIPSVASNQILLSVDGSTQDYDLIMDLDDHHCTQHMIRPGGRIRVALKRSKVFLCS